jgi:WD40 repeat protein
MRNEILMLHVFRLSRVGFLLLLSFTSCQAQTVPRCRPSPPLPKNPPPGVVGLSLSRDGNTLVSAGADGHIRFWDVPTGQVQRTLTGHTNALYKAIFSPDEKLLASSSRDTTARIWDVATGRELHRLIGYRCAVKSVAFSPDGKKLASVGNDGMLKLWDVKTGKELKSLVHSNSPDVDVSIYSVVFSRDGKNIYTGNGDGTISEWETTTGKETKVWKCHNDAVFTLAFSPDYRVLASGGYTDPTVKLWDTATWREIRTLAEKKTEGLHEQLGPIAFSHNGKLIAASVVGFDMKQSRYVYIRTFVWGVETGGKLFTLGGHKFDVDALAFTPDNRFLVSGSVDGTIKFWDIETGQEARTLTMPSAGRTK